MIPHQYRTVAFTDVPVDLDERSLREFFLSRQVYRRTRFVVARNDDGLALVEVTKAGEEELFVDVTDVRVLASPQETILVDRADIDTAVPSQLLRAASGIAGAPRCVVVRGRYGHVNFMLDAVPRRVHVLDVAPPWLSQAGRPGTARPRHRRGAAGDRVRVRGRRPGGDGRPRAG
ncbi:hypothetical protein ACFSTC_55805 [Nonomuraea ferruginea]